MLELLITILIAFLLSACFYAVFFGSKKCCGCYGVYTKEELAEVLKNLPENSTIYISLEKR